MNRYSDRLTKLSRTPPKIYGLSDRFPKGSKHVGRTIEAICYDAPGYILMVNNEGSYHMCPEAVELATARFNQARGRGEDHEIHIRQRRREI